MTPKNTLRLFFALSTLLGMISTPVYGAVQATPSSTDSKKVDFLKDVQPILEKSCYTCHGPKTQMGNLRLDSKKATLDGGLSGTTIVPGKATQSHLYQRIAGIGDQARMPMGGQPLPAEQIAL